MLTISLSASQRFGLYSRVAPEYIPSAPRRAALRPWPPLQLVSSLLWNCRAGAARASAGCWHVPGASPEARRDGSTGLALGLSREMLMI